MGEWVYWSSKQIGQAKKYSAYFGNTEQDVELNAYNVDKFNKENASMFEQTWQSLFDIISARAGICRSGRKNEDFRQAKEPAHWHETGS